MKILLFLLSSLLLSFNLIAGDEYYWAGDKKVNITKDLSTLIVVFKKDRLNLNSINPNFSTDKKRRSVSSIKSIT